MRRDVRHSRLSIAPLFFMLLAMVVGTVAPPRSLVEQETETSREVEVVLVGQLVSSEFRPKIASGDRSADVLSAPLPGRISRTASKAIRGERSAWNGIGAALRL
ncbi:hypothetical protein LOC68_08965 [Blastopirellula sp. JC732]|uniref:Uncharacterized protein n=1 Tax=Blastopirellula sediminis TaxID=2894196 RepID=A0A9X1SF18_9BACT|nr:hypothetical protein [Blastopirellula sediminis]MCC9608698.1 hypothetical protein [Blastopirellula sediminis]MCC9628525.1 hypothetical protein [Blastopirellula sediminis]